MFSNYAKSAIRTLAPVLAGWLISLGLVGRVLALVGADSTTAREWTTGAFVAALSWAYYLIVRALEQRWPAVGVLLGVPTQPVYDGSTGGGTAADADDWQDSNGMAEDSIYRKVTDSHAGGHDGDTPAAPALDEGAVSLIDVAVVLAIIVMLGAILSWFGILHH